MEAMTRRERDALRCELVWYSPAPGSYFRGVVLWRRLGLVRVMYWEAWHDGGCDTRRVTLFRPDPSALRHRDWDPADGSSNAATGPGEWAGDP